MAGTTYWVEFDYDMARSDHGIGGSPVTFLGQSVWDLHNQGIDFQFFGPIEPSPYYAWPWFFTSSSYAAVTKGVWEPNGNFTFTGNVFWNYTIAVEDYFQVGTRPDPTTLVGPVLSDTEYNDLGRYPYTVTWTDWAWAKITIPTPVVLAITPADKTESATISLSFVQGDAKATAKSGVIHFTDSNPSGVTASISSQTVNAVDGHGNSVTLTAAQVTELKAALTITPEAASGNTGAIDWSYNLNAVGPLPLGQLDFLAGKTVTVTSTVHLIDASGNTDDATVTNTLSLPATVQLHVTLGGNGYGTLTATVNGQLIPGMLASCACAYDNSLPVPSGTYSLIYRTDAGAGKALEFDTSPGTTDFADGRQAIQIHIGNTPGDSVGCIVFGNGTVNGQSDSGSFTALTTFLDRLTSADPGSPDFYPGTVPISVTVDGTTSQPHFKLTQTGIVGGQIVDFKIDGLQTSYVVDKDIHVFFKVSDPNHDFVVKDNSTGQAMTAGANGDYEITIVGSHNHQSSGGSGSNDASITLVKTGFVAESAVVTIDTYNGTTYTTLQGPEDYPTPTGKQLIDPSANSLSIQVSNVTQVGSNFYLDNNLGSGPLLKYGGANVVASQFGTWTPIGAQNTAAGYKVAWKMAGADQYTVWNTDSNGNYASSATGIVSGTSVAVESLEPSFNQDLNGDGHIGLVGFSPTVIEANGATSLSEIANHFYLFDSTNTGPSLRYSGADVVTGQFGTWTPIGAEKMASGYEAAWHDTSTGQYTAWNTDSNGNYVSSATGIVSGTSNALESLETSFNQDLNRDGHIGFFPTVIESHGATSLTGVGSNFYLYDNTNAGPSLKFGGVDYVDGQFGSTWTPIGAEKTASGYETAWHNTSADQYTVWNTDNNGNYVSSSVGVVSVTSAMLESLEPSFHQDLNGDGQIGVPTVVVESAGTTSLTEVGSSFYLYDNLGSGPSLKFGGTDVMPGQFGSTWTPIGAEKTASGYETAWHNTSADQYTAWNTDNNGNYVSSSVGVVSVTSAMLESLEPSFHQDLNGDGQIGVPTVVVESSGTTSLTEVGSSFYLYDNLGSGPSLKFGGTDVMPGQFGSTWTPIGAEKTASGYETAWHNTSADQYTVWNTDNNGNYVSSSVGVVSGTNAMLESLEPSFHQDLNADGYNGLVLNGSSGGQTLTAVSSPTTFIGGPNDILNGGSGADTFVFLPNFGSNTVNNFAPGTDELQFSQSMFADSAAVLSDAQQVGSNIVITHDALDVVTLQNVQLASLHTSDIHIV